jgi:molybdate transport system regulatory protein
MSYRRAWQLVEALNESFSEPVVMTATGGRRGGGARVTQLGRKLVRRYRVMENKASAAIAQDLRLFSRHLKRPALARGSR